MRVPMRVPGWELTEIVFSIGEIDDLVEQMKLMNVLMNLQICLLYTSPSPRDLEESGMPSSA